MYTLEGNTNKIKVNNIGINYIKYRKRNNHESFDNFIQPDANDIIKRGIPNMTKTHGPIRRFLC